MTPEEINALPMASYQGPIHLIGRPDQVPEAVRALRCEKLLGFDTETRPAFRKGESYPPALLQLAGSHDVWLFQLQPMGLPRELAGILSDPTIVKAGVSIAQDLKKLRELTDFSPAGFVDLGGRARQAGLQHHGLRGLASVLLGCRISKGAQLTNWARPDLPGPALRYAATDAWIGRRIHEAIESIPSVVPARSRHPAPLSLRQKASALLAKGLRYMRGRSVGQ
jgi:ribonuclease D